MVELLSTCGPEVVEAEAALALNDAARSIHPVVLVATLGRVAAREGRVRDPRWQPLAASARPNGSSVLFREAVEATPAQLREDIFLRQVFGPWTSKSLGPDNKELKTHVAALAASNKPSARKALVIVYVVTYDRYRLIVFAIHVGGPLTTTDVERLETSVERAVKDAAQRSDASITSMVVIESLQGPSATQRRRIGEAVSRVRKGHVAFVTQSLIHRAMLTARARANGSRSAPGMTRASSTT